MNEDEKWMRQALALANRASDCGEIPVGCVIVKDNLAIGKGYNQVELLNDATAHAEILAIGVASSKIENWRLDGCTLYVTLEPCPMCAGAILNSRISRVVYGAPNLRFGACGTCSQVIQDNSIGIEVEVLGDVLAEESAEILRKFFREKSARANAREKTPESAAFHRDTPSLTSDE